MTSLANHAALQGLSSEQLAELALLGLRYRNLGVVAFDFNKSDLMAPYWTGDRMVKKAVKAGLKAKKSGDPLALRQSGIAEGYLSALFNCSVIDEATYMEQYHLLLQHKPKRS